MLNNKCQTSFAKPEYLKKAKQVNPRLYDIGCYNDNLALMLTPDSDEVIRLEKESRPKLSDLVRPFNYAKLNSLYDLFVPEREKSSEQRFFSDLSWIRVRNLSEEFEDFSSSSTNEVNAASTPVTAVELNSTNNTNTFSVAGPSNNAAEAVNTVCYVQNRVLVTKPHNKTPFELLLGRTPSIGFMRPFDCHVTILNTLDLLGKFNGKADEGFLVGYSVSSKAFRVFNSTVGKEAKSVQQYVLLPLWSFGSKDPQNTDAAAFEVKEPESAVYVSQSSCDKTKKRDDKTKREAKGKSPVELSTGVRDLSDEFEEFSDNSTNGVNAASTLVTVVGPNSTNSTNTFSVAGPSNNAVSSSFELAPQTRSMTRMVKEQGGLTQINDEDFHTCMFACFLSQKEPKRVHQALKDPSWIEAMQEELLQFKIQKVWVLVDLPKGFKDLDYPDKVYKVVKALNGLHQAPRAWYETLANYLLENGFQQGKIDQTLFIKKQKVKQKQDGIFISQDKYVAEMLRKFGLTNGKSASTPIDNEKPLLKDRDGEDVDVHTYRSMIGSLMYLTSLRRDIMCVVCACACFQVTPKASYSHAVKRIFRYLKGKPHLGLWYPNLVAYSDSDYAGASLDRKSTTGGVNIPKCDEDSLGIIELMVLFIPIDEKDRIKVSAVDLKLLLSDNFLIVDCLPNEEIFDELGRMGYENPYTKLTFYKVFFSAHWKFLIHTTLQCMSAKRTAWNKFSSSMASAVICLATDTPLFDGMLVPQQAQDVEDVVEDEDAVIEVLAEPTPPSPTPATPPPPPQSKHIPSPPQAETAQPSPPPQPQPSQTAKISMTLLNQLLETCATLTKQVANLEQHKETDKAEPAEVEEVIEVVTGAKLMIEVVTTTATTITAAQVPKASAPRRRRGVIIQDPEKAATTSVIVHLEDEAFAKELEVELNANINWNDVVDQVKRKERQDNTVMRYQALKRKPVTEAQVRKNMMVYLKNMAGFKMDFFRGMTYTEIRPIFKKHYNSIQAFLEKGEKEIEEEGSKRKSKSSE
nr:hypothetical protein [Tanacetum cinerariifolium]